MEIAFLRPRIYPLWGYRITLTILTMFSSGAKTLKHISSTKISTGDTTKNPSKWTPDIPKIFRLGTEFPAISTQFSLQFSTTKLTFSKTINIGDLTITPSLPLLHNPVKSTTSGSIPVEYYSSPLIVIN